MAGFNRCRTGEAEYKKARALKLRADDPNLTAQDIAERLNAPYHTVRRWLTGVGQERTEDARGMVHRREALARNRAESDAVLDALSGDLRAGLNIITPSVLDNLDAFAAGELDGGGVTARPRNEALAALCPESL